MVQFLGISLIVGKEAIGHIRAREGPEEGGMLLMLAAASVVVLSALCGLKLDLSVTIHPVTRHSSCGSLQIASSASNATGMPHVSWRHITNVPDIGPWVLRDSSLVPVLPDAEKAAV